MLVQHHYIPIRRFKPRGPNRGLAERLLKARLVRAGWEAWRAGHLHRVSRPDQYPNVIRKYDRLRTIIEEQRPGSWDQLRLLAAVHRGMPDYLLHRRGELLFVECKRGHEQLNHYQKRCLPRLMKMGFRVEVHKLVDDCTKARRAYVDVENGEKRIEEKQLRLTKKLMGV